MKPLDLLIPNWPAPKNVRAFTTTRTGGVSVPPYHGKTRTDGGLNIASHVGDQAQAVQENRRILRKLLPNDPLWLTQVHGTTVVDAAIASDYVEADASFTTRSKTVCLVQTADCLPVLFCDTKGTCVAATHAGWKGLAIGVLEATIQTLQNQGAKELIAWIGPGIGPKAFEVNDDVRDLFVAHYPTSSKHFQSIGAQKYLGNLYAIANDILIDHKISHISGGDLCTYTDEARFYSFRRDEITGRMATLIWLEA